MKRCGAERKRRKKLPYVVAAVFLFVAAAAAYYKLTVAPVLKTISAEEVRSMTVVAINEAAIEAINDTPGYLDIVAITYGSDNCINGIKVKSSVVNEIARKIVLGTQSRLDEMGITGIDVPVGSLSGIAFLAGRGPDIEIKAVPVGTVDSKLFSEFVEAGINQTSHKLFLRLNAKVNVIMPGLNNVVYAEADVPIIENIIVGKVPDTYLHATETQDMMDLIP